MSGHFAYKGVHVSPYSAGGRPDPADLVAANVGAVRYITQPTADPAEAADYAQSLIDVGIVPITTIDWNAEVTLVDWLAGAEAFAAALPNHAVEIGNEPGDWGRYFNFFEQAAEVYSSVGKAPILAAPIHTSQVSFMAAAVARGTTLEAASGVAVHPYASTMDLVDDKLAALRATLDNAGHAGLNIWITECGWGVNPNYPPGDPRFGGLSVAAATQAYRAVGFATLTKRRAPVYKLRNGGWFLWKDYGPDGVPKPDTVAHWSGLVDQFGVPRPAFAPWAALPAVTEY